MEGRGDDSIYTIVALLNDLQRVSIVRVLEGPDGVKGAGNLKGGRSSGQMRNLSRGNLTAVHEKREKGAGQK